MIRDFEKVVDSASFCHLDHFLQTYKVLRNLIEEVDKELSFLMFTSTIFNACTMYFSVVSFLSSNEVSINPQHISVGCLFVASYVSFIAMSWIGSLVYEANAKVLEKLKDLTCNKTSLTQSQKRILFIDSSHVSLTVWKIIPIRRNLIFDILGTIFTYSLLLNGLKDTK
ncbi:uncharacterized protein TNIN_269411 [Trichonephila inaurata madagascariensis]|uniref:Uncharacterized protein n=1 Tax=Trichonephila inaurata madagascariensis TaxID=2747483 RepID=A0A8X6JV55_9ARAC|nr:uncharacterized protein TNIN_269411 [Trichonephila inaurata madagascariensis]